MNGFAHFEDEYFEESSRGVDSICTYLGLLGGTEVELASNITIDDGESSAYTVSDEEFEDSSDLP